MENSIFGSYSDNLQVLIDTRQEKFVNPFYKKYFPFGITQLSLTYTTVLGEVALASAATIVSRDSETPLRSREALDRLSGTMPAIKVMRKLNENHLREYMTLQGTNIPDNEKKNQALKLIWDDTKYVADAIDKKLDLLVIQGLSTGKITIDAETNPDGLVIPQIDLGMPAENRITGTDWNDADEATPITDIEDTINQAMDKGRVFESILISRATLRKLLATKQAKETIGTFFGLSAAAIRSQTAPMTLDRVNEYMEAAKFPKFEIVDVRIPIEKNGVKSAFVSFPDDVLSFIPAGDLGEIKNAFAIEELHPVEKVSYAKKDKTLISKWKNNEPFGEWTKSELNGFPSFSVIDQIYLLDVNGSEPDDDGIDEKNPKKK